MTKPKRKAYLVSVTQRREAVRVYAVLATTADQALEAITPAAPARAKLEIVGGLSRDTARHMRLEPDELRLV